VASSDEAVEELVRDLRVVFLIGILVPIISQDSKYRAFDHRWWMIRMQWNIKIKVQIFLISFKLKRSVLFDLDC
jgi:hypothetical protein